MEIIIDTREQKPLEFEVPTERGTLPVGDYCGKYADGTLSKVVFERKSINDLYGTLSMGYERFKRELQRAKEQDIRIIIAVEGTLRRVLKGASHSQRTPISIVYQIFTIRVRYGIETIFCTDREEMSTYITHYYLAEERNRQDEIHNKRRAEKDSEGSKGTQEINGAVKDSNNNLGQRGHNGIKINIPGVGECTYTGD